MTFRSLSARLSRADGTAEAGCRSEHSCNEWPEGHATGVACNPVLSRASPQKQSFHSSCGGAGNFSLLVQRKVTKRKHVGLRPRFYVMQTCKCANRSSPRGRGVEPRCLQAIPSIQAALMAQ